MSVTPEQAAAFIRSRSLKERQSLDLRFAAMNSEAERIVSRIVQDFNPVRIYRWGSLLDRSRFRSYSDIDIAVEGITTPEDWVRLERIVWDGTDFAVDLVQLERVEPEYAEIIRTRGVIVHERSD